MIEIYNILQDSLLFQIIGYDEIMTRLKKGDHGTISACTLLLKYYFNGKIFSLNEMQKMVIELSALTIYDHTLDYYVNHEDKAILRYQNIFENNPFSFMFRICDDIEEWDRVYFDITKQSNFLVCDRCKTIIRKYKTQTKNRLEYACCCRKIGTNMNAFKYDRLARVKVCEEVIIKKCEVGYVIHFSYDLAKLLQASAYNPNFAKKRASGIAEVKKALFGQKTFDSIYVEGFISGNPIAIKTEIMSRFLNEVNRKWFETKVEQLEKTENLEEIIESWWRPFCFSRDVCDFVSEQNVEEKSVEKNLKNNMYFYAKMALLVEWLRNKNNMDEKSVKKIFKMIVHKENITSEALKHLIENCLKQAANYITVQNFFEKAMKYKKRYMNIYCDTEMDVLAIESYIRGQCMIK